MNKVFLGGTCNDSTWRAILIPALQVKTFNPVVASWTKEDQENEFFEKEYECNVHFYCITKEMKGMYSIAEAVDSTLTPGKVTILHVIPDGFDDSQLKSLEAVVGLVNQRGGIAYIDSNIMRSAILLNNAFKS
jgi:hypothetical protein